MEVQARPRAAAALGGVGAGILQTPSQQFASYLSAPGISPTAKLICRILHTTPQDQIESALGYSGAKPYPELIHEVLEYCYDAPSTAVTFFRWAGKIVKPTAIAWNLMVDILGKNAMFEMMWDAIRSMKQEGFLSLAPFVSVFSSYCNAGKFGEAIMSFDVMEKYGVKHDVVAVNSLLSAICVQENKTSQAYDFFEKIKNTVPPDSDTFAILLEGWQKEGNVAKAKTTFGEMLVRLGWSSKYMPSYDSFLITLIRGSEFDEAVKFLQVMKGKNCFPGLKFFSIALDVFDKSNSSKPALIVWDMMIDNGVLPNLIMYNMMIGLLCRNNDITHAFRLLDDMIFHAAFPDYLTYNTIFRCLLKNEKANLVATFFHEMVKNESPPLPIDCAAAISLLMGNDDPETAMEIWNYMVENELNPLDDSANALLIGLCKLGRSWELLEHVEEMIDRNVILEESTMARLKEFFDKRRRNLSEKFDKLYGKWKGA